MILLKCLCDYQHKLFQRMLYIEQRLDELIHEQLRKMTELEKRVDDMVREGGMTSDDEEEETRFDLKNYL